ncbi:MAG: malate dehydrogenase [Candidatus Omnitrophica bacterium]|nr:malate dehydrogenase [Candidatus Omnitrophota bacterium]
MQNKITVVGAGNVGASCALYLAQQELGDVVLVDIVEGVPQGKALDIQQAGAVLGFDSKIVGANDYAASAGSDIVVITAGLARKPGMDRLDLLKKNAEIISGIVENVKNTSPDSIIIMVTNPIDVMVYLAYKKSGFPSQRVFGQAGILDSARYATFIAMELGVSVKEVNAMILGGHGDSMVPLPSYSTVSGIPITELIPPNRIKAISDRARVGGGEIVKLLGTGSAYYAPAAATVKMVESIVNDSNHLLPCSVYATGQYGISDLYIGLPAKLGRGGVTDILEVNLDPADKQALLNSSEIYQKSIAEVSDFV